MNDNFTSDIKVKILDNLIWFILLGSIVGFGIIIGLDVFLQYSNLNYIVFTSAKLGFLVLAEGICLLSGNFDLSVGQLAGFTAMLNGILITQWFPGVPWYLAIVTILLIGAGIGAIHGFLIGKVGLNPFLVTLGSFLVLQNGTLRISPRTLRSGFPDKYMFIGGGEIFSVKFAVIILLVAIVLLYLLLSHTRFGSKIYAVGGDPRASGRTGIDVGKTVFWVFVLSGLLSATAGLLWTGFNSSVPPGTADGTVFMAFAGAVLAGTSLNGGRGSVISMLGGVLLIGVFTQGLTMIQAINSLDVRIFFGVLVLVSIFINRAREEVRDRLLMPE